MTYVSPIEVHSGLDFSLDKKTCEGVYKFFAHLTYGVNGVVCIEFLSTGVYSEVSLKDVFQVYHRAFWYRT